MKLPESLANTLLMQSQTAFYDPHEAVHWPDDLGGPSWYMSPEMLSLHGTSWWKETTEQEHMQLSFWEFVNFLSMNIHGEKLLIEGIATRLYAPSLPAVSHYLHVLIDEENKHSMWFGTFCSRYAGTVFPPRSLSLPRNDWKEGEEDLQFFARILLFEELVDTMNVALARDERLHPLAREINRLHHRDESRHIAFGQTLVAALWQEHSLSWQPDTVRKVAGDLHLFAATLLQDLVNPAVYRKMGIPQTARLARAVLDGQPRTSCIQLEQRMRRALVRAGIPDGDPNGTE